jgi:hypothetical protein
MDYQGKPYPYCNICGGIREVADACNDNKECVAFTMDGTYCGYLKKGVRTVYREGYTAYLTGKAPAGKWETPHYSYSDTHADQVVLALGYSG